MENLEAVYGYNPNDFELNQVSVLVSIIIDGLKKAKMYTYQYKDYKNVGWQIKPRLLVYKSVKAFKKEFLS